MCVLRCAVLLAALVVVTVNCVDKGKLSVIPEPDPRFDVQSYAGDWYNQARYVSCSFQGSGKFSDIRITNVLQSGSILQKSAWRSNLCAGADFKLLTKPKCKKGEFVLQDMIGGMVTGDQIIAVFDKKKGYEITYGCTKRSILDKSCKDPWVGVKTRDRHPSKYLMECVQNDLKSLYDMSFAEMRMVSHNNPC